ncbi:hypothetical protein HDU96_009255 [Phlyctochytrium bullatum]|nr:hypothetical protein HDU96_009255 [Phlyctochytrium bullatum]
MLAAHPRHPRRPRFIPQPVLHNIISYLGPKEVGALTCSAAITPPPLPTLRQARRWAKHTPLDEAYAEVCQLTFEPVNNADAKGAMAPSNLELAFVYMAGLFFYRGVPGFLSDQLGLEPTIPISFTDSFSPKLVDCPLLPSLVDRRTMEYLVWFMQPPIVGRRCGFFFRNLKPTGMVVTLLAWLENRQAHCGVLLDGAWSVIEASYGLNGPEAERRMDDFLRDFLHAAPDPKEEVFVGGMSDILDKKIIDTAIWATMTHRPRLALALLKHLLSMPEPDPKDVLPGLYSSSFWRVIPAPVTGYPSHFALTSQSALELCAMLATLVDCRELLEKLLELYPTRLCTSYEKEGARPHNHFETPSPTAETVHDFPKPRCGIPAVAVAINLAVCLDRQETLQKLLEVAMVHELEGIAKEPGITLSGDFAAISRALLAWNYLPCLITALEGDHLVCAVSNNKKDLAHRLFGSRLFPRDLSQLNAILFAAITVAATGSSLSRPSSLGPLAFQATFSHLLSRAMRCRFTGVAEALLALNAPDTPSEGEISKTLSKCIETGRLDLLEFFLDRDIENRRASIAAGDELVFPPSGPREEEPLLFPLLRQDFFDAAVLLLRHRKTMIELAELAGRKLEEVAPGWILAPCISDTHMLFWNGKRSKLVKLLRKEGIMLILNKKTDGEGFA